PLLSWTYLGNVSDQRPSVHIILPQILRTVMDIMNKRWPRISITWTELLLSVKNCLFCPQSEKCIQPFDHRMKSTTVNSDMSHPFCFLCTTECAPFIISWTQC